MLGTAGTWSFGLFKPVKDLLGENSWNRKGAGENAALTLSPPTPAAQKHDSGADSCALYSDPAL